MSRVPDGGLTIDLVNEWYAQLEAKARWTRNLRLRALDRVTQGNLAEIASDGRLERIESAVADLTEALTASVRERSKGVESRDRESESGRVAPSTPVRSVPNPPVPNRVPLTDDQLRRGLEA